MAPPPPRPATSVVENIVEKISSDDRTVVTKDIIITSEETLRKVAIKIKVGGLGKGDSVENRAAIVLDLILRRNGIAIKSNLSKICTMKKKDFESMSAKIGNYMDSTHDRTDSMRRNLEVGARLLDSNLRALKPQRPFGKDNSSIIPILSIKLGSHIPDSFGFAKLTQHLIKDIQLHVWGLKDKFKRSGFLQDMERKKPGYESACFCLVMEENQVKHMDQLKPMLMEVANVQSQEFEDIYKEAKKFYEIVRLKKRRLLPEMVGSTKRLKRQPSSSSQNIIAADLTELAESMENGVSSVAGATGHASLATYTYSDAFSSWRSQTLATAISQARDKEGDLSDSQALQKAADAVLRRFGRAVS
ncbi:hypothetical protein MHU86_14426 [Fragilaria crotonensis]|nr:hypothetical protein MHU86_14426 [Fragilaria crotonensis]